MKALLLTFAVLLPAVPVFAADTPYAGQQARAIKALSDDDIAALRNGEGIGMAKAAELNGYPGPMHVLTLAKQLGLTDGQQRQVIAIFEHERQREATRRGADHPRTNSRSAFCQRRNHS
jgi:hypothetical protein